MRQLHQKFFTRSLFNFLFSFTLTCLLLSSQAFAVIVERQSMRDVSPLIDRQTLVVFDIDNTLIQPVQTLGSDQWFRYVLKTYTDKGMPSDQAVSKTIGFWTQVNEFTHVIPVEQGTPLFVHRMQEAGVKIIVLTARPADTALLTERQLAEAHMDFSKSTISGGSDLMIGPNLRFRRGVLSATGQDKGQTLLKFIQHFNLRPPKIVFVDDLIKNVQAVETATSQAGLSAVNVRYGALDAKVKAYNPKIPLVEWGIFNKYHRLISDGEALRIINNQ